MLNESIRYRNGELVCDAVSVAKIALEVGTPTYVYSLKRIQDNLKQFAMAFSELNPHIHYSAKANGNLAILRTVLGVGAGIDAVSAGEIARAIAAGAEAENIVFAGVGKTPGELHYAVEAGVGWFNVENVAECRFLNDIAGSLGKNAQVALRFNPDVQANTHPHIATGHKGAKFGLNVDDFIWVLSNADQYPNLNIRGIHVHVGSQLGDTTATENGIGTAVEIARQYDRIDTINIGGGYPAQYDATTQPALSDFAAKLAPILNGFHVIIEPGRSIVADAGILVTQLLYTKQQGGITLYIVDGSMTELIRPALYDAHHAIVPLKEAATELSPVNIVGPVCETTDTLGKEISLPSMQHADLLAILDTGAYGMVMASNYNQRPKPPEVVVEIDGKSWRVARKRETFADLMRGETE